MDSTLVIFGSIALGACAVLCVTLAIVAVRASKNLDRITTTLEQMGNDVSEIREQAVPLIDESRLVMRRTDATLVKLDGAMDQLAAGTSAIRGIADDARALEQDVINQLRPSIDDLTGLVRGSVRGVTSFVRSLLER